LYFKTLHLGPKKHLIPRSPGVRSKIFTSPPDPLATGSTVRSEGFHLLGSGKI
jgi:hypothetical protein